MAVAHTGSVSRAAQQLHLTQPAISLKLKQLQHHLGLTLFTRRPQGLTLTAHGYALLPAAEQALASALAFEQSAHALHNTLRGKLTIGTIVDPEFIRLGDYLSRLMARTPQLGLSLARDALAMAERQQGGLAVADNVRLPCALSLIWRKDRAAEPLHKAAIETLDTVWPQRLR